MFGLFKRLNSLEVITDVTYADAQFIYKKVEALEDYLGIEFFHGDKRRPHYRKKKTIIKKVGRPKGVKNKKKDIEVTVVV